MHVYMGANCVGTWSQLNDFLASRGPSVYHSLGKNNIISPAHHSSRTRTRDRENQIAVGVGSIQNQIVVNGLIVFEFSYTGPKPRNSIRCESE